MFQWISRLGVGGLGQLIAVVVGVGMGTIFFDHSYYVICFVVGIAEAGQNYAIQRVG